MTSGFAATNTSERGAALRYIVWFLPLVILGVVLIRVALIVDVFMRQDQSQWDVITYLAAGERLNAGHQLYALVAGDRPVVPQPPYATGPLLSPPLIGVIWRPIAMLPLPLSVELWWVSATATMAGVLLVLGRRQPIITSASVLVLTYAILAVPFQFTSGNVNAFVIAGLIAVWWLARSGHEVAAGAIVAILAQIKLVPLVFVWWLVLLGLRRGVKSFIATSVVALVVTILAGGPGSLTGFLSVQAGAAPFSLGAFAIGFGVPAGVADWLPVAFGIAAAIGMVLVRRRPDVSFVLATLAMLFGSPAVNQHSYALLLVALAPLCWTWTRADVPPLRVVLDPRQYVGWPRKATPDPQLQPSLT